MGRKFWKQDRQKIELTKRGIMGELQNEYNIEDVIKITKKPGEQPRRNGKYCREQGKKNSHCHNFPRSLPLSFLV